MTNEKERRTSERLPVQLRVDYQSAESFISEYTMNISRGGMFISTRTPLNIGTTIELIFRIPNREVPFKILGEVAWITPYDRKSNLIPGMGIRFKEMKEEDKKAFDNFIEKMKQQV